MSSINLHPEKGVNPKLTYCPRCGGPGRELILIGADEGVYKCSSCEITVFGYGHGTCPSCKKSHVLKRERMIGEHEKLPGGLCEACEKEEAEHKVVVEAGGVYFRCADCGVAGVIKGTSQFAIHARKQLKVEAPKPCGIEFTKKEGCPKCGPVTT
jgi:hypothetical protein